MDLILHNIIEIAQLNNKIPNILLKVDNTNKKIN